MELLSYDLFEQLIQCPHLLIGGATGTGKSVVINGIVYELLFKSPQEARLILIDPKRVELNEYKRLPHTLKYASEPDDIAKVLDWAVAVMENRYTKMQHRSLKKTNDADVYIIIDEFADLMVTNRKECEPLLIRLAQLGRAARVHLICATQNCTTKVLDTRLKSNFPCRLALRTAFDHESRNIIGMSGCELLPMYGEAYFLQGAECKRVTIPQVPADQVRRMIEYWK